MKPRLSFLLLLFCAGLAWFGVSLLTNCTTDSPVGAAVDFGAQYLGDEQCATCHREAWRDWKNSDHDLAMQEATPQTVLGDFDDARFGNGGKVTRFFKKDGRFFVNAEGHDGRAQDFEVRYTFGVFPLQQYLVEFPGGRLQCLLTAWDSKDKKWFSLHQEQRPAPGDWMHWTGGSMTWNTMCADCHSTYLQKNYDEQTQTFETKWAIMDVSCEACHGPGRQHVKYVGSTSFKEGEKVKGSYLHLTADLTNRQQVDECARCHSRRSQISAAYDHSGTLLDHYVPEILQTGLYHADGQILDEVYVYGSFLQSKMYRRNVRCTDCHNPHSLKLKFESTRLCTQCHKPEKYDTRQHHFHSPGTESAACINCHMPGKFYMVNDFRRDHSFRVPRPDLSERYGTPNACNHCHSEQSAAWAAAAVRRWYGGQRLPHFSEALTAVDAGKWQALPHLAAMVGDTSQAEIVQATALYLLGELPLPEAHQKIAESLQSENPFIRYYAVSSTAAFPATERLKLLFPLLTDPVLAVRSQSSYMLAGVPEDMFGEKQLQDYRRACRDFENILKSQADFPAGQMLQGQYFHKKKNLQAAEKAYREALRQDPLLAQAHLYLANLYYQQQKLDAAETEFEKVTELQPEFGDAYFSLGLLQAERQNLSAAEANLKKAAGLTGNPRHFYNWGLVLQYLGRPGEAEEIYKKALSIAPDSEVNLYALAVLYVQQGRAAEAKELAEQMLRLAPRNPSYQELMGQL
ncbi:MAG: tetratricopeptide repeat protein [Saprospiraceae bacterium]